MENKLATCPKCNGTGKVKLTKPYATVLSGVEFAQPICTSELCHTFKEFRNETISINTMSKRLTKLFNMKLIDRKLISGKTGPRYLYTIKESKNGS